MKNKVGSKLFFRLKFLILHPARSCRHLLSKKSDYSKIPLCEIQNYLSEPKTIIEAGAADGVDTLNFSSHFPLATVFAIEPVIEQYEFLIKLTKDRANIQLSNLALSNKNEEVPIYVGSGNGNLGGMGSSSLLKPLKHVEYFPEISFTRKQLIQGVTLEQYIQIMNIDLVDLLWLDIQGKELDVMKASEKILKSKVKLVHLEISRVKFYQEQPNEREIRKFLVNSGFICVIDRVGAISGNAVYRNSNF